MGNQNNTLEGHLNSFKDPKATKLAAAWTINKAKLTGVLSLITAAFPTYSLHDASHSETIVENIERLLGNKISKLGATDTFMLLMAAYTHDLGMYLSYKVIEDKWKTTDFAKRIKELENNHDPQIAKAAKLLRETQDKVNNPAAARKDDDDTMCWALEVKNAVTLLTIELFRGEHAKRSENYLNDDNEFARLLGDIDQYGGMRATLAKIAYLHYEDFSKVFILEKEAKGFAGTTDVCHPRFVACMIRLGDLLDFDNNRFNSFAMAMVKEVPETSLVHYKKHYSTGGELSNISSTEIRVTFDCDKDDVYREAAKWKKMVEEELFNMHAYWSEIAPEESSGKLMIRLPSAKQIKIKLKYNGKENPNPALMNLRFDISSKKTFEMLKGGAIYKEPGRVFLREIVQNAMDATKLQIWRDLKDGCYLPWHLENPERDIKSIDDIKFSDDIPVEVYDRYPINLYVEFVEEKEEGEKKDKQVDEKKIDRIRIICEDYGTGITEESLIRMTSKVGESRKADKDYDQTINGMPYFLQPTAAFGLGLQTVFYVANEFIVETCCPDKTSRRIIFRTSTNGSYCSVDKEGIDMHRGTKVIIEIDKNHFANLFELDKEQASQLVTLPESVSYYIPEKLNKYIKKIFKQTENIPFSYHSPFGDFMSVRANAEFEHIKDETDFRVFYKFKNKSVIFRIEEITDGSSIEIDYKENENYHNLLKNPVKIQLRDVPVITTNNIIGGDYVSIKWNLFCRDADSFVTISRDELLPQGKIWCNQKMSKLVPKIIQLTHEPLLNLCKKNTEEQIKVVLNRQYFSLCLIDWQMPKPIISDFSPILEFKLSFRQATNKKTEPIFVKELLKTSDLFYIDNNPEFYTVHDLPSDSDVFLWDAMKDSIPNSFVCNKVKQIVLTDKDGGDYKHFGYYLSKISSFNPQTIEVFNEDVSSFITNYIILNYSMIPSEFKSYDTHMNMLDIDKIRAIPGIKGYETIIVCNNAPLLGYIPPYHCNCWIYPPQGGFLKLGLDLSRNKSREEFKQILEKGKIKELVPEYLIKIILKHNILTHNPPTKEVITSTYIRLILDYIYGVEKFSE